MKSIVYSTYGPPEVLRVSEVARPVPGPHEVLVRVQAATVASEDAIFRRGSPWFARAATGWWRPKVPTLGSNVAGRIEATGSAVTRWRRGDAVYAASDAGFGGHAEFVCLHEDGAIAPLPRGLTPAQAASLASGGLTALPFLRDGAGLRAGQSVIVNGASGAVGTAAVQIAKLLGARVTGACGPRNQALVASLGADRVVDYTQTPIETLGERYDVVFDTVGKSSYAGCRPLLVDGGVYLCPALSLRLLASLVRSRLAGTRRARILFTGLRPAADKRADLQWLSAQAEAGTIRPVVGRVFPLDEAAAAHRLVDTGHKVGHVIVAPEGAEAAGAAVPAERR